MVIDPSARLTRAQGSILVAAAVVAGIAVSRLGVRFDGSLDLHIIHGAVPFGTALADQGVAVVLPAGIAWAIARIVRARPDPATLFVAVGVIRVPAVVAAPLLLAATPASPGPFPLQLNPTLLTVAAIALALIAWQVTLLVFGIRSATGLGGGRLAGAVIALVVSAELLSKLVLELA